MANRLNKDQQNLVNRNFELAEQVAWRFGKTIMADRHEKSITMDDLKEESILGLCEAAMRYDTSLGIDFTTLAFIWCKKFVVRAMRKYGTPLTVAERAEESMDLSHIDAMMGDVASAYANYDDDGSPADRIFFQLAVCAEAEKNSEEALRERIKKAMSRLNPQEQIVLSCLSGLDGKQMTCKEVALMLAVNLRRIQQINERALRKLERILSKQ